MWETTNMFFLLDAIIRAAAKKSKGDILEKW